MPVVAIESLRGGIFVKVVLKALLKSQMTDVRVDFICQRGKSR